MIGYCYSSLARCVLYDLIYMYHITNNMQEVKICDE